MSETTPLIGRSRQPGIIINDTNEQRQNSTFCWPICNNCKTATAPTPIPMVKCQDSELLARILVYIFTYWPWDTEVKIVSTESGGDQSNGLGANSHANHTTDASNGSGGQGSESGVYQSNGLVANNHPNQTADVRNRSGGQGSELWCDHESNESERCLNLRRFYKIIVTPLHMFLIIAGVISQLITCFSRQNPYAHWVQDFNESITVDDNDTSAGIRYCHLMCEINKNFITGFLFPDLIFVLLSFWIHLVEQLNCLTCEKRCKRLKDYLKILSISEKCIPLTIQKPTIIEYTLTSILYILCSLSLSVFYLFAFEFTRKDIDIQSSITSNSSELKSTAIVFSLLGFIAFDLLYIQVITRYAYCCNYLINDIIKPILTTLKKKEQNQIKDQDITKAYEFLSRLNESSTATGIVILLAGFTAISCVINLLNTTDCPVYSDSSNKGENATINKKQALQVLAVTLRLILWIVLALFPLYKAAKVTKTLRELSFQLTMSNSASAKEVKYLSSSEVRLMGISVQPWSPDVIVFLLTFTIMLGSSIEWHANLL